MKAWKIDMTPYDYEQDEIKEDGTEHVVKKSMPIKYKLPRILCNPNLRIDPKKQEPDKDFDLMEIGPIAQRMEMSSDFTETSSDFHVTVTKQELEILKKRIKAVSKFFGYIQYEMFRRVTEAEEIELQEKT